MNFHELKHAVKKYLEAMRSLKHLKIVAQKSQIRVVFIKNIY